MLDVWHNVLYVMTCPSSQRSMFIRVSSISWYSEAMYDLSPFLSSAALRAGLQTVKLHCLSGVPSPFCQDQ